MKKYKNLDRNGEAINAGDVVRIVGVPDLKGMSEEGIAESLPVFQYLVGKYKRVRGFDEYGCAEFDFVMRHINSERSMHSVWLEPFFLHVPQRRQNPAVERDTSRRKRRSP